MRIVGQVLRDLPQDSAILFECGGRRAWVPRSLIRRREDRDGKTALYLPLWLVERKFGWRRKAEKSKE